MANQLYQMQGVGDSSVADRQPYVGSAVGVSFCSIVV